MKETDVAAVDKKATFSIKKALIIYKIPCLSF